MNPIYSLSHYLLKRQVFSFTGTFRLFDGYGRQLLYSRQKMFKLREDIRVYADEGRTQEMLYIQARSIVDFSAAYDIYDSVERVKVGTIRRKGWQSMVRDTWEILDPWDRPLGILQEDSQGRAILRRVLLGSLLPQDYDLLINNTRVADYKQRFNLFRYELDILLQENTQGWLDPRVAICLAILLAAVEGKQN